MILSLPIILACIFASLTALIFATLRWLDQLTQKRKTKVSKEWSQDLSSLFLFFNTEKLFWLHVLLSCLGPILIIVFTQQFLIATISATLIIFAPRYILHYAKNKRISTLDEQLPDGLLQIAGALKAGASLLNALELLSDNTRGPLAQELSLMVREYRLGSTIEQALSALEKRVPSSNISLTVTIISIAQENGGNLAESLERLAGSIRQKLMLDKKIAALTSQGKLQGIVVGLLPIVIAVVLGQIETEAMSAIFKTWLGYCIILLICILEGLGLYFIRKIINIDV